MEECLVTGLCQGRWDAAFCGVPAQSPREFPSQAWVLRYKDGVKYQNIVYRIHSKYNMLSLL